MVNFIDYCKDWVSEHIGYYEGQIVYLSDLGYLLTEDANANGTLTYSRDEVVEYLKEWWDEAADYFEWEKFNFGTGGHNPFANPEAYMVCMVIEGVRSLVEQAIFDLNLDWNGRIELTRGLCSKIKNKVKSNRTQKLF